MLERLLLLLIKLDCRLPDCVVKTVVVARCALRHCAQRKLGEALHRVCHVLLLDSVIRLRPVRGRSLDHFTQEWLARRARLIRYCAHQAAAFKVRSRAVVMHEHVRRLHFMVVSLLLDELILAVCFSMIKYLLRRVHRVCD